jgi:CRP/FNR family transcriptional regulator
MEELKFENYARRFGFWDKLTDEQKQLLIKNTLRARYKKGETIHGGRDECIGVIFVVKGSLRAYILSDEGREITLYRLYDGDTCMLSASCAMQAITFDVFIDAEEDTEAFLMNTEIYKTITSQNVYVDNFLLNSVLEHFSDVMWTMQQILFMSFDKRLAIFLTDEAAKTGSDTIKLTHEQIAKYVGSAREVVSRMLKYFSTEGLVNVSRNGIEILDKKRLLALATV